MKEVRDQQGNVIATGDRIDRVDDQGEKGLIRVFPGPGDGFYYLGHTGRDGFVIADQETPVDQAGDQAQE